MGNTSKESSFSYFLSLRAERIIASAIQLTNGQIFVGKRHADAQINAKAILGEERYLKETIARDGFITTLLRFVDRKESIKARQGGLVWEHGR